MPKRWLNECSFEAFNAAKSEFLKADCSELVFKNVLPAAAGSTFLQNDENEMHQSKKKARMHFANDIFNTNSYHDPSRTVILQLARHWLLFFENHKISPTLFLGRPGGMRGVLVGD